MIVSDCFQRFKNPVDALLLPEKFTFPFYYDPHPLAEIAATELKEILNKKSIPETGQLIGVLVVQHTDKTIGYIAAYTGKQSNEPPGFPFVPAVFSPENHAFFTQQQAEIQQLEEHIRQLKTAETFISAQKLAEETTAYFNREIDALKQEIRTAKAERKLRRIESADLPFSEKENLFAELAEKSIRERYLLNDLERARKYRLDEVIPPFEAMTKEIADLEYERQKQQTALHRWYIDHFTLSDSSGNRKTLRELFGPEPPIGAGECPAPKLLEYAFQNALKPLALAEFWWGPPPGLDIRNHGWFYPSCRGKCEPILKHMVNGIETDESPVLQLLAREKSIETLYDDEFLAVICKPAEMLSIPGGTVKDSVETRMRATYPDMTGMVMVHRLDMSTSGLMVITKTKDAHEHIQRQFEQRTVKKRYVALLDGIIEGEEGIIRLPLLPDPDDLPRQMVHLEKGKPAITRWKVIERRDGKTLIHFFPETGRTHQLRIHAAHPLGLNAPIHGDELYGTKADRLYLHAEALEFQHPSTGKTLHFETKTDGFTS